MFGVSMKGKEVVGQAGRQVYVSKSRYFAVIGQARQAVGSLGTPLKSLLH